MADPALVRQWALCGIAAAAARFLPVPLLDDVVRQRAARTAVVRTLRAHGRDASGLEPLWGEPGGRRGWLSSRLRKVSTRLLLFPVRKYAAVFGAVRGVPADVMRVVLLARTVDRCLARGELLPSPRLPEEARAVRAAVEQALDGTDLRVLTAALSDALSQTRGLSTAALGLVRRAVRTGPDDGMTPDAPLAEGAERVTEVLRRPEVGLLLERFDAAVDAQLRRA